MTVFRHSGNSVFTFLNKDLETNHSATDTNWSVHDLSTDAPLEEEDYNNHTPNQYFD
jgi:hypothetical protein